MNISQTGIKLIQSFEGCLLVGYKDAVGVPTIGWGHTGNVVVGQRITQERADELLKQDLKRFVDGVNDLDLKLNQNQFDALCSFAYNTGNGTLRKLVQGRSLAQIAQALPLYNKGRIDGELRVLNGLTRRRNAEKDLFLKPVPVVRFPYPGLQKEGSKGSHVKLIQSKLGIADDGIFGPKTEAAVKAWQKKHKLTADGLVGPATWRAMFK